MPPLQLILFGLIWGLKTLTPNPSPINGRGEKKRGFEGS
jgi:hypothetical protein